MTTEPPSLVPEIADLDAAYNPWTPRARANAHGSPPAGDNATTDVMLTRPDII
ncbi:MAG TPA: hypothetical protein VFA60_05340 [Terriglobales bacterium]|nr:hypothetical protein [Terriglobales bacterium]